MGPEIGENSRITGSLNMSGTTPESAASTREFWSKAVPMSFEDQPKSYEEKRHFRYSLQDYMHEAFGFDAFKGKRVLEVGIGSGIDFIEFLRNQAIVTGIDFSPNSIKNSKLLIREAKVDGQIVLADAAAIPFKDHEFDVVYSFGVIHHIPNVSGVLAEVNRVLVKGGIFMGMVYNRDSLLNAYSIIYTHGIREGLLFQGTTEHLLASNFSERLAGNQYTKLYTVDSLIELLRGFFRSVDVHTYYNVIDTPRKRKLKFELEGQVNEFGWHLAFKALK